MAIEINAENEVYVQDTPIAVTMPSMVLATISL